MSKIKKTRNWSGYYRAAATAGSAAVAGTWLAPCLAQLVAFGLAVVRDREGGSSQGLETT